MRGAFSGSMFGVMYVRRLCNPCATPASGNLHATIRCDDSRIAIWDTVSQSECACQNWLFSECSTAENDKLRTKCGRGGAHKRGHARHRNMVRRKDPSSNSTFEASGEEEDVSYCLVRTGHFPRPPLVFGARSATISVMQKKTPAPARSRRRRVVPVAPVARTAQGWVILTEATSIQRGTVTCALPKRAHRAPTAPQSNTLASLYDKNSEIRHPRIRSKRRVAKISVSRVSRDAFFEHFPETCV